MKRYDQYRIEPREGGATDYKFYSKYPEDGERADQRYSRVMEADRSTGGALGHPIPPDVPEPAAREERAAEYRGRTRGAPRGRRHRRSAERDRRGARTHRRRRNGPWRRRRP